MANIKQQIKRIKTSEKKRIYNSSFKSATKTIIKKYKLFLENNQKEEAKNFLPLVYKKLDKGAAKGIFHKNFASRKKSLLSSLLNN